MMKRFIVLLNDSSEDKNKQFLSFIKDHKLAWWHWLINSWLLIDYSANISAAEIRDNVKSTYGEEVHSLVMELKEPGEWAGRGPMSEDKNMFKWIEDYWYKTPTE